jgi:hypothetical protein
MNKHLIWMIVGCTVPLLLILLLPLFGITGNYSSLIFIIIMFACHLMMPMHHHRQHKHGGHSEITKTEDHESHQH